ncbi:MAG: nucleotidyl transferase AbiEii/AbiGii toxin family protein [Planctomycetota bacterium]
MGETGAEERDLAWLRRQFIVALAVDAELYRLLVFKGGNALNLLHGVGERSSLDLDYSLEEEPDDQAAFGTMIESALVRHLRTEGIHVFDWRFVARPKNPGPDFDPSWGGYCGQFKVIEAARFEALGGDIGQARQQAWGIAPGGGAPRKFRIELSKFEYCAEARAERLEGQEVRVYTLAMIAIEKLRSLCQQMHEYARQRTPSSRARDFYDIHAIVTEGAVNLSAETNRHLFRAVFEVKAVPLRLLQQLEEYREMHRVSWPAVRDTIPEDREQDFDYYFEYVVRQVERLDGLW